MYTLSRIRVEFADSLWRWLAWKLPRRLVMWCMVRITAHATQGQWNHQVVPELTAIDALKRWEAA